MLLTNAKIIINIEYTMKKLIYSMLALLCVALTFTSCGGEDISNEKAGKGTIGNPYSPTEAIYAVQSLKWRSNTDYDKTGDVYIKGKISRIASGGTFAEGGTYGNASFFISADGSQNNEFYCFRILYLGNKKYETGQTDIRVGDEVVVCGKLMNYQESTPETVSGQAYLVSLISNSVSFLTNATAQVWTSNTDGIYGSGYSATTQGLKVGYYKHTSTMNAVVPNESQIRIYKNSVLSIATTNGRKIKKIVIGCISDYCYNLLGLEGAATAVANTSTNTITWEGSASKVVLHAANGQVKIEKITVEFE